MTFEEIKKNKEINEFINKGNYNLGLLGYTDHSQIHCSIVADTAAMILKRFGYCEHDIELAKIAGYMHDIGNAINRSHHAEYGGLLANEILKKSDMTLDDIDYIVCHQANERIINHVKKKYPGHEDKFYINIAEYGNTSAASIPIALDELAQSRCFDKGRKLIIAGFGAGLSWSSALIET